YGEWFGFTPLSTRPYDPSRGADFYALALIFNGLSSTLTAANLIVTMFKLRAPGMSFNRLPTFCYAFLAASFGLLFALPALSADCVFLFLDRNVGTHFFDVSKGGSNLLWQHPFWFFGHPEVYILIAGFIWMFVNGGLTGLVLVAIPFDQQVHDTYFIIAHFHYIIFGAAVFPIFGGMYYWFPKLTGKLYFELPGQISFWIIFAGT